LLADKPHWPNEQSVRDRAYGFVSGAVNLSCEAVAEPEPDFEWIKDNNRIGSHNKHAKLFREPNRSVLQVSIIFVIILVSAGGTKEKRAAVSLCA
jgi:hypothetical protein